MTRPGMVAGRAAALFIAALLAFNPPILSIFTADVVILGLPLLFFYLFCGWAVVILLIALQAAALARTLAPRSPAPQSPAPQSPAPRARAARGDDGPC